MLCSVFCYLGLKFLFPVAPSYVHMTFPSTLISPILATNIDDDRIDYNSGPSSFGGMPSFFRISFSVLFSVSVKKNV